MIKHHVAATLLSAAGVAFGALHGPGLAYASAPAWDPPRAVVSATGQVRHVVKNANDCAPFEARAVWGPGPPTANPLGYRCYHNPNGG